ncbi:uncharacterized protein LOC115328353 [Ixodes scapularis]|uniref:uncharacterized protein LOC115328353 n=1 Tax=Ixodes scapularis TaxID=6945 RepID=UPI001A9D4026|nr:uncharacterized protein LOC115328353 [Ixodes scapularis]
MQGQTKMIIFGTVMIVYAIQNGVLSQGPTPFTCYEDIKTVGEMFCTITGQRGFTNIFWKDLVLICTTAYLNLSIPFNVTEDQIVVSNFKSFCILQAVCFHKWSRWVRFLDNAENKVYHLHYITQSTTLQTAFCYKRGIPFLLAKIAIRTT